MPAASRTVVTGRLTLPLLCGKNTANAYIQPMLAELYGATIKENGTAVRQFSPCVVDGVAGMRDAVSGDFFGNAITNGYTKFFPGDRTDVPTVLAVAEAVDSSACGTDVFSSAKFWLRGMAVDVDGNGVLTKGTAAGEVRDALRRTSFVNDRCYGLAGFLPRFTNDTVRMPGRGVTRQMQSLYFPQTVVITNEATGKGYVNATTLSLPGAIKNLGNHWTFLLRAKPDMASAPANGSQWTVKFGHSGKQGVMVGFSGSNPNYRALGLYSTATGMTYDGSPFAGITITNGWFDLAVIADGQRLTIAVVRDADVLKGSGGDTKVGTVIKSMVLDPKHNLAPADVLVLGAEEVSDTVRPYPMGANDNGIKAFRGNIQQFAVWDHALSRAELFSALGWPRTDLWRVGVEDGGMSEFRGEVPADGIAVDAETWSLQEGVSRTKPLTLLFPVDAKYETLCGQMFRWKAIPGSADGRLELTLNGRSLGTQRVRSGAWSQWFVPAEVLQSGTNTAVLARKDTGSGSLCADVIALGGGVQVGGSDNSYGDFVQESYGMKHLYAGDGNLHDVRRVLYCQRSSNSNFYYHVTIPSEMVNERQRWRFTLGTTGCNFGSALKTHPISVDVNGKCLGTHEVMNGKAYTYDIEADDVVPGENVFNLRNGAPNTGTHYTGIDYFALEPLRPIDATFLIIR